MYAAVQPRAVNPFLITQEAAGARSDIMAAGVILLPAALVAGALYFGGSTNMSMVVVGLAFVVACFAAPQIGFYAYFAFQALDAAFTTGFQDAFTPAKALGPFLLLPWLVWFSRSRVSALVSKPFVGWMCAFGMFGVFTAPFAYLPLAAVRYGGQVVVQAIMLIAAVHMLDHPRYIARALFWTVVGGVILAAAIFVTGGVSSQFGRATFGEYANPNTTAMALAISLAVIPAAWALTENKLYYIFYSLAPPFMLAAMFQTGSRSAIASLIIGSTAGVVFAKGGNIAKRALIAGVSLTIVMGSLFFAVQTGLMGKIAQERIQAFVSGRESVATDSRSYIWAMSLEAYMARPAIGSGYGNSAEAFLQRHGLDRDVHNTYLGALVDGGPVAAGLMAYSLWLLFRAVRRAGGSRVGIPAMILLFVLLFSGISHTIQFTKWFWVPATICFLLAEFAERQHIEQESQSESASNTTRGAGGA